MGLERRGRADQGHSEASPPGEEPGKRPGPKVKSFEIGKRLIVEAWEKVRANNGAPGVDAVGIGLFAGQLRDNLYGLWNGMSSGSYFPGPVRGVEIPKDHGEGVRLPGVPNTGDGWRRLRRRCCWSRNWSRSSTATATATVLGAAPMTRWPCAATGAGQRTGERRDKPAWRRDMRTSCIEGVAIHGGLGSCVGVREDAGEALTEGNVGWVIEPRNHHSGVPTPSQWPEGNIAGRASASCQRTPRGQRACACVESSGARTGRSRGCPSGCDGRAGRSGNAKAVSPR